MPAINKELVEHRLGEVEKDVDKLTKNTESLTKNVGELTTSIKLLTNQFNIVKWTAMVAGASVIVQVLDLFIVTIGGLK